MKDIMNKKVFIIPLLLSTFLSLILIINYDSEITCEILFFLERDIKIKRYTVMVVNKTELPIYFCSRFSFDLFSTSIHNNEKIHHLTLSPAYEPDMFDMYSRHSIYCDIHASINGRSTKKSRVRGDINYNNHNYIKNEFNISKDENNEFCTDIHFIFYFTRQPYSVNTYAEYIEIMRNNGYAVKGSFIRNRLIFIIDGTELQINDSAIANPLNFVYELVDNRKGCKSDWH